MLVVGQLVRLVGGHVAGCEPDVVRHECSDNDGGAARDERECDIEVELKEHVLEHKSVVCLHGAVGASESRVPQVVFEGVVVQCRHRERAAEEADEDMSEKE